MPGPRESRQRAGARWLGAATALLVAVTLAAGLLMGVRHGTGFFRYPVV